jgi:hypothetical protein
LKLIKEKRKTISYLLVATILLAVLVLPHQAKAVCPANPGDCVTGALEEINKIILEALGYLIEWAAKTLEAVVRPETQAVIINTFVVQESWKIIRDFMNMFFILFLIIMAFGTIFDIDKYHWRNLLPYLLIAALLINFSMVIGEYIIKIGNGLAAVFLRQISGFSNDIANGFSAGKAFPSKEFTFVGVSAVVNNSARVIITGLFSLVFLIIVLFAFIAALLFAIIRIPILWFLLIVSPIAWAGYVLPNIRAQTWSKWWNALISWSFFLPVYLFFLMFAIMFIRRKVEIEASIPAAQGTSLFTGPGGALSDLLFYILTLIFLIFGLKAAYSVGSFAAEGAGKLMGKLEGGVKRYFPGAAYARGAWAGIKARGEEIKEKGILGIGGAQRTKIAEATAKGWVAGTPGPGRVPGAREGAERARLEEINKETEKLKTELLRIPAEQRKQFLVDARNRKGVAGEAAMFEYVRQGYSTLEDYKKAMEKFGGENTVLGRQYLENLKQARLSDLFRSPEEELQIAKGEVAGTKGFIELRRALFMDLAKRNRINNIDDYREAKQLLSPIPAELKSFIETIKPEFIFGTKEARREALLDYKNKIADSDLAEKLVAYMTDKDRKEITSWEMREKALEIVGGKDTFEGKRIVSEINKYNPVINIEADMRTAPGAGPVLDREELVSRITKEIEGKTIEDIKKMSADFFKNSAAQEALRKTLDSKDIAFILKGAPREVREALKNIATEKEPERESRIISPSGVTGSRTEETQRSREEILRELGKIP